MVPLALFGILAAFISTGVECGYSSASSGASSAGDGSGSTFTASSNNGQGTFQSTQTRPGTPTTTQSGTFTGNSPPYYAPANFGQGGGFGINYSPGFPYGPYGIQQPAFTPFPQGFGFNSPFQPLPPLQPFQPLQPLQPFAPIQPLATPQQFSNYLNTLEQQYAAGGSVARSTPGATAFASSYLGPTKFFKQQQQLYNAWKDVPYTGYGTGPNYAYASGAYGLNNGIHQTAGVFPPNKNKPNVDTRFEGSGNPSGYFGIQTSSFSSSSDVNGVKKHKEGATTTVNDNGKVSTYHVEN